MRKRNRHGNPQVPADTRWGKRGIALFFECSDVPHDAAGRGVRGGKYSHYDG